MNTRPNILLVTSDQQRYDTLGTNGNSSIHTPHLDNLAREGISFDRAYVNNPVCIPSRACIQSGRYTHQHGVEYMEYEVDKTPGLPPWEVTFMERLQVAGYYTAAFGKMHMYPAKGFHEHKLSGGQGARWDRPFGSPLGPAPLGNEYAAWLEARHPGGFAAIHEQRRQSEYREQGSAVTSVLPMEEYVDTWVTENCIDFLHRRKEKTEPFFLWCGFLNPHTPLDAPEPYDRYYNPQEMTIPKTFLADVSDRPSFYAERQRNFRTNPDQAKLQRLLAFYYGLCTMLDDLSGRLFDALRDLDLWDNTLIIYTSDHGDMMGDYGMMGKGNFMEGSTHVPLMIKPPHTDGEAPSEPGRRSQLVELIDVAATVLDYGSVAIPEQMEGTSLRALIEGREAGKEEILCEYTLNDRSLKGKSLRTDRYKYNIWLPGRQEELYDMAQDPDERHNLVKDPDHKAVLDEMRTCLIDHLMRSEKPATVWL